MRRRGKGVVRRGGVGWSRTRGSNGGNQKWGVVKSEGYIAAVVVDALVMGEMGGTEGKHVATVRSQKVSE